MFNFLKNIRLSILLLPVIVMFFSCDGRERKHKTNVEVFNASNHKDSILENIKYFPESYFETITDTILSNGFEVKIKTYADMNSSVLNEFKVDTIVHKHYYRDAISEITVLKNKVEIVSEKINKSYFLNRDKELKQYFETANLSGVWVNQNDSISENEISIYIMFCKPETDNYFLNEMIVSNNGTFSIKEII